MNKVEVGRIIARGGLNQAYQDISVQIKLGERPKLGLEVTLRDNLTNEIIQKPVQIMFNENELNKLANLKFFLNKAEQTFRNYVKKLMVG